MLIASIVSLNAFLATTFLPTLFLPLTPTLHALRVSLAYRGMRKRAAAAGGSAGPAAGWLADLVGYLVMCWGGSFLVAYLSHTTPAPLLTIYPFLTYTLVHIYVTTLHRYITPNAAWLDTALPLIDGATRSAAIRGGVTLAAASRSPGTAGSLLCHVLAGTLGACGGGQLAGMLGVANPSGWKFGTLPVLTAKSLIEATDVLAALAGALTYSLLSGSHPVWTHAKVGAGPKGNGVVDQAVRWVRARGGGTTAETPWTPEEAQAATTLVVAACFALRAVKVHHWGKNGVKQQQNSKSISKSEKKGESVQEVGGNGNAVKAIQEAGNKKKKGKK